MKKISIILIIICLTLFVSSCAPEEPITQPTPTSEPIVDPVIDPTPAPEPTEPIIEVSLDNYHTRYIDDDVTKFDISVTGDFDSYEIMFIPIENTSEEPTMDENGQPNTIGSYKVIVNYLRGSDIDTYESDVIVTISDRPTLFEQLSTSSEIPYHVNWGEEIFINVDEDKIIETDYYIAHLVAGSVYSSWLFPFLDYIIEWVHNFTGLYLPDSGERFNIYFSYDGAPGGIRAPSATRNRAGELVMYLPDGLVGIDTGGFYFGDGEWNSFYYNWNTEKTTDSFMIQLHPTVFLYTTSHEFAHILDIAFFTENLDRWSFVHGEGFATFISSIAQERITPEKIGTSSDFPLSENFDLDLLHNLIHNRLEYMISRDMGSDFNSRTTGSIFYLYIYEEFGIEKVIEVFGSMIGRPSGSRIEIVNNILGVDITETFPSWYDENVNRIPGYWS